MVPYDEMSFGFIVLVIINASCIIAKGLVLAYTLIFGVEEMENGAWENLDFYHTIVLWIVICILPHIFFVSRKVLVITQIC